VLQLGQIPDRIDLLTAISGVDFDAACVVTARRLLTAQRAMEVVLKTFLLQIVFCLALSHGIAAAPVVTPAAAENPGPAARTFDVTQRKLPPQFAGDDIRALFSGAPRGEFESSADYAARTAIPEGTYAFVVRGAEIRYDADRQQFAVAVDHYNFFDPAESMDRIPCVVVDATEPVVGTYVAANAFGAQMQVTAKTWTQWAVVRNGRSRLHVLNLPVPRDQAPAVKESLAVLLICRLGAKSRIPARFESGATGHFHHTPTRDVPADNNIDQFAVRGEVLAYWLFDRNTGNVLARYDDDGRRSVTR
jgi:hypothetical protein